MKSSIYHFIRTSIIARPDDGLPTRKHLLLLFDASGCVTKTDLAVLRQMVPTIVATMQIDVSLICVNHEAKYVTPYSASEFCDPDDCEVHSRFTGKIDMLEVLADRLSDEDDGYDGIVVMTAGEFAPFSVQCLSEAARRKSMKDAVEVPPIGFFMFSPGAIPADPAYVSTRHIALQG